MSAPLGVAAVILAAGEGSRLGGVAKALLALGGRTYLETIVATARAAGLVDAAVVVGEPFHREVAAHARQLGLRVRVNPQPARGMASSVALGFAAIASGPAAAAWLWPVDHPAVTAATLAQLIAALGDAEVAQPRHAGRGGHPPLIRRALWPQLAACGDQPDGARRMPRGAEHRRRGRRPRRGPRRRHRGRPRGARMRASVPRPFALIVALLAALTAGCPGPGRPAAPSPVAQASGDDPATRLAHVMIELEDDILASYERDDPPELDTTMIVPKIGAARIGAGPGDVYIAGDLARAPSRWPLDVDRTTRTDVRSKKLEIQLAADLTAAWMVDELSWRIETCGRTAVIPLRITALYAHDGDRWVPVFEHLSFGWTPTPRDGPLPKAIKTEVVSGDLRDELSGVLGRGLLRTPHDPQVVSQDPSALVLGPDAGDEWHGPAVLAARLPAGKLEDRRVGTVGRTPAEATVAYWIGNYIADIPAQPHAAAGKVRMRVTHVFEKRRLGKPDAKARGCGDRGDDCRWMLVQTHMSQPITDDELTQHVFGTALISSKPLQLDCVDEAR